MNWLIVTALLLLGALSLLNSAALVEVFKQLAETRIALNLEDKPIPLGLKSGELRTDEVGLPPGVAREPRAIVVFLSEKCVTCLTLAEGFRGESPAKVWFVIPHSPPPTMLMAMLESASDRVVIDEGDEITSRIGLNTTPMVLSVEWGTITRAQAVSSLRQLRALIPSVVPRQPAARVLDEPYLSPAGGVRTATVAPQGMPGAEGVK